MIFKLAGTSGSGKSSLFRALLELWDFAPVLWSPEKPKIKEYRAKIKAGQPLHGVFDTVVVLGDYRSPCGGMDGVSSKEDRYNMVAQYAGKKFRKSLVLCEGLLFGGVYGITEGLGVLSERGKNGVPWVYAFMDTPLEVCLERCRQRRAARGVTETMNPANTTSKHRSVYMVRQRVLNQKNPNQRVYDVEYKLKPSEAARHVVKFLEEYAKTAH
jgi:hypothetical protein